MNIGTRADADAERNLLYTFGIRNSHAAPATVSVYPGDGGDRRVVVLKCDARRAIYGNL